MRENADEHMAEVELEPPSETNLLDFAEMELIFENNFEFCRFFSCLDEVLLLAVIYLFCSSASAFCSLHSDFESYVDSIVLFFDVMVLNIASSFFVLCGFLFAVTKKNMSDVHFKKMQTYFYYLIFSDCVVSVFLSLIFSTLQLIMISRFDWKMIPLTIFEGFTMIRCFDVMQTGHFHNLNVTIWPVLIIVWCFLCGEAVMSTDDKILALVKQRGVYVFFIMFYGLVVVISSLAIIEDNGYLFYSSATSFFYRFMEFSIGIHFYFCISNFQLESVSKCLHENKLLIVFLYVVFWSPSLGVQRKEADICHRIYVHNQCLHRINCFLPLGIILGLCFCSNFFHAKVDRISNLHNWLHTLSISVCFAWPIFSIMNIFYEMLFHRNTALQVLLSPFAIVVLATLYEDTFRQHIANVFFQVIRRNLDRFKGLGCFCKGDKR